MVVRARSLDRVAVVVAVVLLLSVVQGVGAPSAGATVPGEDGRIAYVSEVDGDLEIFSVNPDGSDPVNLTNTHGIEGVPIDDLSPAWSPDGRWIAFTRAVEDVDADEPTIVSGVWIMAADGSNQTELVRDGFDPTWSPDGRSIAFAMPSVGVENGLPTTVIAVLDLKTDTVTILTDPGTWTNMGGEGRPMTRCPCGRRTARRSTSCDPPPCHTAEPDSAEIMAVSVSRGHDVEHSASRRDTSSCTGRVARWPDPRRCEACASGPWRSRWCCMTWPP